MRRAISYSIREVLKNKEIVYLKGIGTLKLITSNKNKKKKTSLLLDSDKKASNKSLLKLIRNEYRLSKKSSEILLSLYTKLILKKLRKHAIVTIPTVAILSKSKNELAVKSLLTEKVKIKAKSVPTDKKKKKSKELKSSVISAIVPFSHTPEPSTLNPKTNGSSHSETKIKSEVGVDIDQELMDELNELNQLNQGIPQKDELKEVLKDHFYQEDEENLQVVDMPEPIDNTTHRQHTQNKLPHIVNESNDFRYKPWIIGALSLLAFAFLVFWVSKLFIQPTVSESSPSEKEEIGLFEFSTNLQNSEANEADIAASTTFEKCIIITGSFSEPNNEELMKDLIISNGYTPYSESFNSLTRVGVEIECNADNVESILNEVRQNINSQAWYLYPPDVNI